MKKVICCGIIALLLVGLMGSGVLGGQAASATEGQSGKSWYLFVDDDVSGQINQGDVHIPCEVYLSLVMKNEATGESAQGHFIGTAYQEFKVNADGLLKGGKSYVTGSVNTYSFAYNVTIPLSQLGQDVNYTEYSGQGPINFIDTQVVDVAYKPDQSIGVHETVGMAIPMNVTIRAYPGADDLGLDVTVTFTDPDMTMWGLPAFQGKLISSDEMREEDYDKMVDMLDEQINRAREEAAKEPPADPVQAQIDSIQSQIDALNSKAEMLENAIEQGYTDPTTPQGKATALEAADARAEAEILQQQLDGLKK